MAKVEFERDGKIGIIRINRPEVMNCFDPETLSQFKAHLDTARAEKRVRIVLICGNGRAFSAGMDLKYAKDKDAEQKLQDEIQSKRMEGQALVQQGNANLERRRQELLEPILEETRNLIKKLAIEESYDIILEKQLIVLYLNPELDITSRVVVMLDKVYKERASSRAGESEKESEGPVIKQSEVKDTEEN